MKNFYKLRVRYKDEDNEIIPYLTSKNLKEKSKILKGFKRKVLNHEDIIFDELEFYYDEDSICNLIPDVAYWRELRANYIVVSEKFRRILPGFNLGSHKFFDCKVKDKERFLKYYLLQYTNSFEQIIDFKRSIFVKWDFDSQCQLDDEPLLINSFEDYKMNDSKLFDESSNLVVGFKQVSFEKGHSDIDIFNLPSINGIVISEHLRNAIVENNITGVEIKELKDITFSFD